MFVFFLPLKKPENSGFFKFKKEILTVKNGELTVKNGELTVKNGGLTVKNGGLTFLPFLSIIKKNNLKPFKKKRKE